GQGNRDRRIGPAGALADRLPDLERRGAERTAAERLIGEPAAVSSNRGRRPLWRRAVAAVGFVTAVLVATVAVRREPPSPPVTRSVAVVPFRNAGADTTADYLKLALTDEVITILSRSRILSVRPLAITAKYDGATADAGQVIRDLHVGTAVSGYFSRTDDRLRVSLEATDGDGSRVIWRDQMDG